MNMSVLFRTVLENHRFGCLKTREPWLSKPRKNAPCKVETKRFQGSPILESHPFVHFTSTWVWHWPTTSDSKSFELSQSKEKLINASMRQCFVHGILVACCAFCCWIALPSYEPVQLPWLEVFNDVQIDRSHGQCWCNVSWRVPIPVCNVNEEQDNSDLAHRFTEKGTLSVCSQFGSAEMGTCKPTFSPRMMTGLSHTPKEHKVLIKDQELCREGKRL